MSRRAVERLRQADQRRDGDVTCTSLDEPEEPQVERGLLGELFLRQPQSLTTPADVGGNVLEENLSRVAGHVRHARPDSPAETGCDSTRYLLAFSPGSLAAEAHPKESQ